MRKKDKSRKEILSSPWKLAESLELDNLILVGDQEEAESKFRITAARIGCTIKAGFHMIADDRGSRIADRKMFCDRLRD